MSLDPALPVRPTPGHHSIWRRPPVDEPTDARPPGMSGKDAVDWAVSAMRMLNRGRCPALAEGVELGMKLLNREQALPNACELTVQEMVHRFATATVADRQMKLAQILALQVTYPRAPLLLMGLRFVAAVLWSSYAGFGLEGEEAKRQSISVKACSAAVWKLLGWNSRWFDSL